jgi:tripartite-type tricarboxylate transporter receptor subunit TctC
MTRVKLAAFLCAALVLGLMSSVQAQNYPNKTITFVVPFAPGGLTDIPARVLAAIMQEKLGVSIVVENKTGGSGVIGASYVWRAEPDGYTLLVNALADVQNLHYIKVPYNAVNDFSLIGKISDGPSLVLIIDAKLPYRTLKELVDDAKANPNKISFATSGPATSPAIALTQLNHASGTKIVDVPYRGSGEAAGAVATGAVQATFTFYSSAKPLIDGGKVRALAVASSQRIAGWSEVPTMQELGYANFDHSGFVGLAAPAKAPPQVIAVLNKALNEAIHSDAFKSRMEPLGMTIPAASTNSPENFAAYMRAQTARQAELAKLTGHDPMAPKN